MHGDPQILVTRPEPDASDTAARLQALGLHTIITPMLEMRTLPADLPPPDQLVAIALTSANALRALDKLGHLQSYLHLPCFAVGNRTADHAHNAGFTAVISADGNFSDLVTLLEKQHFDGPVFYPMASNATGNLVEALAPARIQVRTSKIYQMQPVTGLPENLGKSLAAGEIAAVSLYSRHTAQIFCDLTADLIPQSQRRRLTALCLSENVAAPMITNHFTTIALADYPSEEAMMSLALSFARDQIS